MNKYKYYIIVLICFGLFGLGLGLNTWFTPHVDVQGSPSFEQVEVNTFIESALNDIEAFNTKYLSADGESKIIEIKGHIEAINKNMNGETVILLKDPENGLAGVMCTLIETETELPEVNRQITIKGIVRSGAEYDEDLELYIDAVLEKGKILQ